MAERKVPMRRCMGCMESFPKKELIRVVRTKISDDEYEISLDLTGKKNGRGAYLCKNAECLKKARKAKRIERALECAISDEIYETFTKELLEND